MNQPDEPAPDKKAPRPEPSRWEEARWVIEEYASDLRQIINKLRQSLH
jgi:signal recognition particle subunit SEC65